MNEPAAWTGLMCESVQGSRFATPLRGLNRFALLCALLSAGCATPGPVTPWVVQAEPAGPQPVDDPRPELPRIEDGLTLREALTLAMARSPSLLTVRRELNLAGAQRRTAGQYPFNPALSLESDGSLPLGTPGDSTTRVGVTQELEIGGQRGHRIEVADTNIKRIRDRIADAERRLRAQVAVRFYENLMIDRLVVLADRTLDVARKLRDAAQARFEAKQIPAVDVDLVRLQYQRSVNERARVGARRRAARLRLASLMGAPGRAEFTLEGELAMVPVQIEPARALAYALATRSDLAALQRRIRQEEAQIALERSLAIPNPEIGLFYTYDRLEVEGLVDRSNLIGLEIRIPIPLFNKRKGEIAEARARRRLAWAAARELRQQIQRDIDLALNRLAVAEKTVVLYEKELNVLSRKNLTALETAYRAGEVGTLQVLRAQEDFIRVVEGYQAALLEHNIAKTELESALGGSLP